MPTHPVVPARGRHDQPRSVRAWVAGASAMTVVDVLLYANLTTPDQPVEHPIAHRNDTSDPLFLRTMTHLLGSQVVPWNRVTALLNGDQAFPVMLEAIRSARRRGRFDVFPLPGKNAMVRGMAADVKGRLWYVGSASGRLGLLG